MSWSVEDFARRQLEHLPKPSQMGNFIPGIWAQVAAAEMVCRLAELSGYSPEEIARMRAILYEPREPSLVSLDDIYGKEGE